MIGESASRSSLEFPGRQLELLQAVVATGTPVVLVLMNGRPLDLRWASDHVPAILDIWYPGTRGGEATANLLFGDVSPGGKLPFTWPRTAGQVPMIYSHTKSALPRGSGPPILGRGQHAAVPVRVRIELRGLRVRRSPHRSADHHHRRHGHRVGRGHQHRRSRSRRGGPAVHPPAVRHGVATRTRTQGLPADHARRGRVTHGAVPDRARRAALLERRRPRLGHRRLDLRRLGRRRLHGTAGRRASMSISRSGGRADRATAYDPSQTGGSAR